MFKSNQGRFGGHCLTPWRGLNCWFEQMHLNTGKGYFP